MIEKHTFIISNKTCVVGTQNRLNETHDLNRVYGKILSLKILPLLFVCLI